MIVKKRSLQLNLFSHASLLKRMNPSHPEFQRINSNYFRAKAGVWGEETIDYQLSNYHHPYPHVILQDVHLLASSYFQMDSLFITQSFILIIEVKNIKGNIELLQNPFDMIRINEHGEKTSMDSPEEQLGKNILWLEDWLRKRNWTIPVKGIIVFANMESQITINDSKCDVIKGKYLSKWLRQMDHHTKYLTQAQVNVLGTQIYQAHENFNYPSILAKYNISKNDVITGVKCPICFEFGLIKHHHNWICSQNHRTRDAHLEAIEDYFNIFGMKITNRECRRFLHIECKHMAKRLLKQLNLEEKGFNKTREYVKVYPTK